MRVYKILGLVFALVGIGLTVVNYLDWPALGYFAFIALPLAVAGFVFSIIGGKRAQAEDERLGLAVLGLVLGFIATVFSAVTFFTCGMIYLVVI